MIKRVLLGTVGLGLALLLLAGGWIGCHSRDLEAVDDADLRVDALDVSAGLNAAPLLDQAAALLDWPESLRGEPIDELIMEALNGDVEALGVARPLVARNKAALTLLGEALAAPTLQVSVLGSLQEDQPELVGWERLGQLLSLRSLLVEKDEGLRDLWAALGLGRRVETARGGNLLHAMTGLEIRRNALTAFHSWIEITPLVRGESHDIARRLERYHTDPEAWARTWTAEYLALKGSLRASEDGTEVAALGEAPSALLRAHRYHPNRTLAGFAERYRIQAANGGRLCSRLTPLAPGPAALGPFDLPTANAHGERLLGVATPSLERFQYRRCAADTRVAAIQAMAGIRAYWDEHRDLPETLDALVPEYLDTVPRDPFDGESLRWNLEHAWVYSVGDDFRDELGRISLVVDDLSEPTYRFLFCAGPFGERKRHTPTALRLPRRPEAS